MLPWQALFSAAVGQDSPFTQNVNLDTVEEQAVTYEFAAGSFEGTLVWDTSFEGARPIVVVFHDADGPDAFELWVAQRLANAGYAAFVADLWGADVASGSELSREEQDAAIESLVDDPTEWLGRVQAALDAATGQDASVVDPESVASIGYGFGGATVLELARSGADVLAVAAVHPTTLTAVGPAGASFEGRVLVVVGDGQEDVASADIFEFEDELRALGAVWEVIRLAKAKQAFTLPTADDFDVVSDIRTWHAVTEFLQQVFDPDLIEYLDDPFSVTGVDDSTLTSMDFEYMEGDVLLRGFVSYPADAQEQLPVMLIIPDWDGIGDYEKWRTKLVAMEGYVGFTADIYGANVTQGPSLPIDERRALTSSFFTPVTLFRSRMAAALAALKSDALSPVADASKVVAIGYCFGGRGVGELMRDEPEGVIGVGSFHGGDMTTMGSVAQECNNIATAVFNGANDWVTDEQIDEFIAEMNAASVNWEWHNYGGTVHSFTNPEVPRDGEGNAYNPVADLRSWESVKAFMETLISEGNPYVACPESRR
ncbi:unnamed protein product [Ostreobium quekettii]|uniref:Dienelactone hydrolase domain-containing protein n=1 Tax=Ostreobium quekettii TaxID=121088 RepID=A0A8S1IW16_9CHLO|nr:unnamed protein product [Ostreobium quekettii]|eukprot:evm.model.scf_374.4 EVM.evm.TU.scf_374.4   scf_374:41989-49659(+)